MLRNGYVLVLAACAASGQVRTLTLKEAVELASARNPEVAMARLDERKAEQAVRVARSRGMGFKKGAVMAGVLGMRARL